ncbi:MAG TPA: copper-translocating P-type ATPase, partial [Nitrospirota bacterium]|nr:copper-translocating P-type ATPase [Nitrospirota bacterium]
ILLGRFLENSAKQKASLAVSRLMALQPHEARVMRAGERTMLSISSVVRGDRVEVRPGEKIPLDGIVLDGGSEVDESLVTGESFPVQKIIGSAVIGGSLNGLGSLVIEVTGVGQETMIARIARLVESAQAAAAPIQRIADRVSAWFIPLALAAAVGTWWYWSGRTGEDEPLLNAVAVLVIACPCALGLATPVAILAGTGSASRKGILIKGGEALERLHSVDTVILDKTGTVTTGKMEVVGLQIADLGSRVDKYEMLQYAASAEQRSEHLVGSAIVRYAKEKGIDLLDVKNFEAKPGRGVQALVKDTLVLVGTRRFLEETGVFVDTGMVNEAVKIERDAKAVVWIANDNKLLGFLSLKDAPKPDAVQAIGRLRELGIDVTMITGDNQKTAESVARTIGVQNVIAGMLPAGKGEEVQRLRKAGRAVAMVGDGINDAPALAAADVGMAMATGTDIAAESASVVLMRPDLSGVVEAIEISKCTFRIIRQNLFWAFAYNVAAIPLAMAGILSPIIAAAAMAASSVTVVTNSLRLR